VIYRGRFAKTQTIDVNEITRALAIRTRLHFMSYVLIEYGAGHLTSVQPDDEQEFIRRLHSLQDRRTGTKRTLPTKMNHTYNDKRKKEKGYDYR
jgi:hypothetical protein